MESTTGVMVGFAGATTVAAYLVAFFKISFPSAPSWQVVSASLLSGILAALLIQMAGDGIRVTQKVIAGVLLVGIGAAAAAAGINRTNQTADKKREQEPGGETPPQL